MTTRYTIALPISGGKFVNQIAACILLVKAGYKPDIALGSSGGCVTFELLMASDIASVECDDTEDAFNARLKSYVKRLTTDFYCVPRSPIAPVNTLIGIAHCSTYDNGAGPTFLQVSAQQLRRQPELWIGTTNWDKHRCQLFCTKSRGEALLDFPDAIYLNNNFKDIMCVGQASASLPTIVPPTVFRGIPYRDGGLSRASPLGPFIQQHLANKVSYHVVYVSPVRYSKSDDPHEAELEEDDIWNNVRARSHGMLNGWHVPDRNNGVRVVIDAAERHGGKCTKERGEGLDFLRYCLAKQRRVKYSFIELAPLKPNMVRFLFMKEGDAYSAVCKSLANGFSIRHWYY